MEYDGVILKPDLDEALEHYGVLGMKWGIRKDLALRGEISKKRRKKIEKAISKASYNKHRRILNALEEVKYHNTKYSRDKKGQLRFINNLYTPEEKKKILYKSNIDSGKRKVENANRREQSLNEIYSLAKQSAKNKGYKYVVKNTRKVVDTPWEYDAVPFKKFKKYKYKKKK